MSATTGLEAGAKQPDLPLPSTRNLESNCVQIFPDRSRDVIGEDHSGVRISQNVPPLDLGSRAESMPPNQSAPQVDGSPVNRSAPLIYYDLMIYFFLVDGHFDMNF
jgi:hypothetical protein